MNIFLNESGFLGSESDLIQREKGSIASFIEKPIRYGAKNFNAVNSLEVAVFWSDEYKYN